MIDSIDWSRLKHYSEEKYRSFEELCYQIAKGLYGDLGRFTSINDSGGGDGVEFYLTFPDGMQWGWQAKFYYPDGRLGVANRREKVKRSLQKACEIHPKLTRWFLCTPVNLTPGDQKWFDQQLLQARSRGRAVGPPGQNIELHNWGGSDFLGWLSEPRFVGKRLFFFGELELTPDWFRTQSEKQIAAVRDRFNPLLHTGTMVDSRIHDLLGDGVLSSNIEEAVLGLEKDLEEYEGAAHILASSAPYQVDWGEKKSALVCSGWVTASRLGER